MQCLAGINPDPHEPGFKHIIIKPNPVDGLECVKASHVSPYGSIECNWKVEAGNFFIEVTVPDTCIATLYLPYQYKECTKVQLKGNVRIVS
jgi:alpha-L-rhamnosidase